MPRFNPHQPAVPANTPVIRVTPQLSFDSQLYEVSLDYLCAAAIAVNQAALQAFLTAWRAACEVALLGTQSTDTSLVRYYTAEVAIGVAPTLVTPVAATAGTVASHPLPGPDAAIITKYTNVKGQHGRGRMYMPSVPLSFTTPGTNPNVINATGIAAYGAWISAIVPAVVAVGANWTLSVSERPLSPSTLVSYCGNSSNLTLQAILGTVRRRREGRGI
jgi:hypothetical protein